MILFFLRRELRRHGKRLRGLWLLEPKSCRLVVLVIVVLVFPFGLHLFFWLLYAGQAFKVYTDGEVGKLF